MTQIPANAATTSTGARPSAVARAGLAFVPEDRGIFPNLTVQENLTVAARARLVRLIPFSIVQQREVTCDIFARYLSFATTEHAPIERVIAALRGWKRDDEAFDALPVSHNH